MAKNITKCNRKRFLLITIVLLAVYWYINHTAPLVDVPVYIKNHTVPLVDVPVYIKNHSEPHLRIYCFIITAPKYFDTRARAVNSTWAKRCDRYIFISEYSNDTKGLPIAPLPNLKSGYWHLTQKSVSALHYVYKNFANDYDWVVKADDDTYLFVDKLRLFLKDKNSSEPISFGYNFKIAIPKGYQSGGGGYVLSRESVKRFYQAHQKRNKACRKDGGYEDAAIAGCLRAVGVYPGKSVDEHNRERFHHLSFSNHFLGPIRPWLMKNAENKPVIGPDCCSSSTISFHYVSPENQYLMETMHYGFHDKK